MLAKVKGTNGIELTGKTESATATMHDTLELRAHDEARHRPEALPQHGKCGPEAPAQGRLNEGECEPEWLLHKLLQECM